MQLRPSPPARVASRRRRWLARNISALLLGAGATLGIGAVGAAPAAAVTPTNGTIDGTFSTPASVSDPSDVAVELMSASSGYRVSGYTFNISDTSSSAATYQFTGVSPGQYYVYFTDPTENVMPTYYGDNGTDDIHSASVITVTAGGISNLNSVSLTNGATITGTVSDANAAAETYADVSASFVTAGEAPDPNLESSGSISLTNGKYTVGGLPPGTYTLYFSSYNSHSPGWVIDYLLLGSSGLTYDYGSATQYAVGAGSATIVNFSVPALSTISGTVSGPNGPVAGDGVEVEDLDGDDAYGTATAVDGTYSATVLPGTYKVSFSNAPGMNLASAWYGGATEALAAGVNVGAGATAANINVTLGAGGTISGTVVSAQGGAPLGDIAVDLVDAQGNFITGTETLPNGTYELSSVPAGAWYVRFDAGQAYSGSYYAQQFYGGTQTQFGAAAVQVSAGQAVGSINAALLPLGTSPLGLPTESGAALSGLHNNKVALKFNVAAGTGAGYLHTLTVSLPKGFSWNTSKLASDLSLGSGIAFTDAITNGSLVVTLTNGEPSVSFSLQAGGIKVTKAIEKAAGGLTATKKKHKKHKKKKHANTASAAKAKKKKKPTKAKDTIKSELINLSVSDTTGATTSLPITINKPH